MDEGRIEQEEKKKKKTNGNVIRSNNKVCGDGIVQLKAALAEAAASLTKNLS